MTMPELSELYEVFVGTECAEPNEQFYIDNNVPNYQKHKDQYDANVAAINYVNSNDIVCVWHDTVGEQYSQTELAQAVSQAIADGYTLHYYDNEEKNDHCILGVK